MTQVRNSKEREVELVDFVAERCKQEVEIAECGAAFQEPAVRLRSSRDRAGRSDDHFNDNIHNKSAARCHLITSRPAATAT